MIGTTPSNANDARATSPCDSAYDDLRMAQDREAHLVSLLAQRLEPALRPHPPKAGGVVLNGLPAPQSEIHGRFMAAAERSTLLSNELNDLLDRLTL